MALNFHFVFQLRDNGRVLRVDNRLESGFVVRCRNRVGRESVEHESGRANRLPNTLFYCPVHAIHRKQSD